MTRPGRPQTRRSRATASRIDKRGTVEQVPGAGHARRLGQEMSGGAVVARRRSRRRCRPPRAVTRSRGRGADGQSRSVATGALHRRRVDADDLDALGLGASAKASRSARNFDRSYAERKRPAMRRRPRSPPRRGARRSWRPTRCRPRVRTPAAAAARTIGDGAVDVRVQHRRGVAQAHRVHARQRGTPWCSHGIRSGATRDRRTIPRTGSAPRASTRSLASSLRANARTWRPCATRPAHERSADEARSASDEDADPRAHGPAFGRLAASEERCPTPVRRSGRSTRRPRRRVTIGRDGHRDLIEVPVADPHVGVPDREEDRDELHVGLQLAPDRRGATTVPSAAVTAPRSPMISSSRPMMMNATQIEARSDGDQRDQHAGHQQLVRRGVEERSRGWWSASSVARGARRRSR